MVAQGSKVTVTSYNSLISKINETLGNGAGQRGYGQTLNISTTNASAGQRIRQPNWAAIKTDLLRIAAHQGISENASWTAGTLTSIPTLPSSIGLTTKISATHITAFENALDVLYDTSNIYRLAAGQYSDELLVSDAESTRTTVWNKTVRLFFTVDFGSADNARYFFNAGGTIRFTPTFTKSVSDQINNDWDLLINNIGTVSFGYTNTSADGSSPGTGSSIGFYDLNSVSTQIHTKIGAAYTANDYTIKAYCDVTNNTTGTARYIYFEVSFNDDKTANPNFDENVQGTLKNAVRVYRPSGSNVSVNSPAATVTVRLDAAQV